MGSDCLAEEGILLMMFLKKKNCASAFGTIGSDHITSKEILNGISIALGSVLLPRKGTLQVSEENATRVANDSVIKIII